MAIDTDFIFPSFTQKILFLRFVEVKTKQMIKTIYDQESLLPSYCKQSLFFPAVCVQKTKFKTKRKKQGVKIRADVMKNERELHGIRKASCGEKKGLIELPEECSRQFPVRVHVTLFAW